jgi:catechol 2,3-dioxygenase-like lactoylglutathione lyase family enzyme
MRVHGIIADLQVPDIEASREFYADYLGLSTEEMNLGWVARFTSPETGAHLQVLTHEETAPEPPVISVRVDDVDAA